MEEIKELQSVFISKDGKKFKSKTACEMHEDKLDKIEYIENIKTMNTDELYLQVVKFIGKKGKQYIINLNDAFELAEERELFNNQDYFLYKNYVNQWCIGHIKWESIEEDVVSKTIPEVICRFALLKFHELLHMGY